MNLSRPRKLVDSIEERVRSIEADLTAALRVHDLTPLRKLRESAMAFVTDAAKAAREIREFDSELTPIQVPTSKSGSNFRAVTVGQDVTKIFDDAKGSK